MTTELASVCTLDCPDTCSLTVTVDEGRITKVRGSDALPYTGGVICNKVAHHTADFVHGAGRLHYPAAAQRAARLRAVRADRAGTRRSTRSMQRVSAVIDASRPAGRDAAQLCGPARHARGRQHVAALLPQARRDASSIAARCAARCAARPGPAPTARCPASGRRRRRTPTLNIVWGNNATVANLHLVRQICGRRSARAAGSW